MVESRGCLFNHTIKKGQPKAALVLSFAFFFVVFTLISLLSYSPADPSIHSAGSGGRVHNLFGVVGAHLAGLLIGLFGMGAFWIPLLLLLGSLQFFGSPPAGVMVCTAAGGILLVLATAGLLAIHQDHYLLFEKRFSSGGLLGIPIKAFLIQYTNPAGAVAILGVFWLVGFILATAREYSSTRRRSSEGSMKSPIEKAITRAPWFAPFQARSARPSPGAPSSSPASSPPQIWQISPRPMDRSTSPGAMRAISSRCGLPAYTGESSLR